MRHDEGLAKARAGVGGDRVGKVRARASAHREGQKNGEHAEMPHHGGYVASTPTLPAARSPSYSFWFNPLIPPPQRRDDGPDGFQHSKGTRALKKAVGGPEQTRSRERQHEPPADLF